MVAISIAEIRNAFDSDDASAAVFARRFLAAYTGTAFGVLPKTEIDILVFTLLVQTKLIDAAGSIYRTARALNVTPAKARSLLFQYQLRNVSEADLDHQVMMAITTSKYWKDGGNLSFGVASPLVQAAIKAKMQDGGVFADISLSGEILRVNPEQFGAVVSKLVSDRQAARLLEHLKSKGIVNENAVRDALSKAGTTLAKEVVDRGKEKALDGLLEGLSGLISEHGAAALDLLGDIIC